MSIIQNNLAYKILNCIKLHRENRNAPVDLFGCKAIGQDNKLKIFIAILLSSQTRDEVTYNSVKILENSLKNGLTLQSIHDTSLEEINKLIKSVGFHNKKSVYLKKIAEECLITGLPNTFEGLIKLPGVGEKMAYLYMQHAENKVLGISVDTHVHRVSNRIGLVKSKSTKQTREKLENIFLKDDWYLINNLFVGFGQTVCKPVKPNCKECNLNFIVNITIIGKINR